MKTFRLQRLANHFPLWTKVRADPSSMGQRFLAPFAHKLDAFNEDLLRMQRAFDILQFGLGVGTVYSVELSEADGVTYSLNRGGLREYVYPSTLIGVHPTLGDITLIRDTDFEVLLYGTTTRISVDSTVSYTSGVVWDSASPTVYNDLDVIDRIAISITGSTNYLKKTRLDDRLFVGEWLVKIVGRDANDTKIQEIVNVRDDGVYWTKNSWSVVTEVFTDGFDGAVKLYNVPIGLAYESDDYHVAVLDDIEGPLKLSVSGSGATDLRYFTDRLKRGWEYRKNGEVFTDNEEEISVQRLRDSSATDYTPIDLAIHPDKGTVYVLADDGFVHVYEHGLTTFDPPRRPDDITLEARVVIQPLQSYVELGAVHPLWTFYQYPRDQLLTVEIKRLDPAGVYEYLQADRVTWAVGVYQHLGVDTALVPEASWVGFKFSSTYDQVGQWDYYCTVYTEKGETFTSYVGVMVDYLDADVSIDTSVSSPLAIFFSEDSRLAVVDATDVHYFQEHRDACFIDPERNKLIARESYTSIEVSS